MRRGGKDFVVATLVTFGLVWFLVVLALGSWKLCALVWEGLASLVSSLR